MSNWLPRLSVQRPVTVVMGVVALLILGVISLGRIPLQMMPAGFSVPYLWVWVDYGGGTPLETTDLIVRPVEEQLATVAGIKEMSSSGGSGGASVELQFYQSTEMSVAYNQVVDRMERVLPDLPDDVERYYVYRWNPNDTPVQYVGVSFPEAVDDPYRLMSEVIQRRIERISGVGQVDYWGVDEKVVWIDFDRERIMSLGVDIGTVIGQLSSENFQMSGGQLTDRGTVRYVRSLGRLENIEQLSAFPVRDGVRLDDIADVQYRIEPSSSINRLNGQEAAGFSVQKESGANTVEVCRAVRAEIEALQNDPELAGFEFFPFFDQGEEIEASIGTLTDTAMQGGLFAILVLFFFLREVRMTLLIAACIPFSLLISIVVLYFRGDSLDLLSMMGLMIAVGMVVDNAIVVVETIYRRRQEGGGPAKAAVEGAGEVSLAITMSTLTTMVVFLPVILMSDDAMFSFFMGKLGFPVVWALVASLFVALVFTPLTTLILKPRGVRKDDAWISWLSERYTRLLRWVLAHRADTLMWVVAISLLTVLVPAKSVGCNEEGDGDLDEINLRFTVPASYGYYDRLDLLKSVEGIIEDNGEEWALKLHRSRVGGSSERGSINIYRLPQEERPAGALEGNELTEAILDEMPDLAGVRFNIGWENDPNRQRTMDIRFRGEDPVTLERLVLEAARRVEAMPGVIGARPETDEEGQDEIRMLLDREAAGKLNLSAAQIGRSLSFAMRGSQIRGLRDGDREVTAIARFEREDRADLDTLLDFPLWLPEAQTVVPIRSVTEREIGKGWSSVRRHDRETGLDLVIDLEDGVDTSRGKAILEAALEDMAMPRGYRWEEGRRFQEENESNDAMKMALLLSVTFVFLLMGVLFESLLLPLAVITTIPMAVLGVYWTLFFTGDQLAGMAGVGLVVLIGVVVNNGIVLLDLVTKLRKGGLGRLEALVEAGNRRLRPILMTALTTLFGLLPMALGSSTFVGMPYAPLARVVAGGLVTATVLTLFFVPLLYSLLDDMRSSGSRWLSWVWLPKSESR